jgi:hypothetical protein
MPSDMAPATVRLVSTPRAQIGDLGKFWLNTNRIQFLASLLSLSRPLFTTPTKEAVVADGLPYTSRGDSDTLSLTYPNCLGSIDPCIALGGTASVASYLLGRFSHLVVSGRTSPAKVWRKGAVSVWVKSFIVSSQSALQFIFQRSTIFEIPTMYSNNRSGGGFKLNWTGMHVSLRCSFVYLATGSAIRVIGWHQHPDTPFVISTSIDEQAFQTRKSTAEANECDHVYFQSDQLPESEHTLNVRLVSNTPWLFSHVLIEESMIHIISSTSSQTYNTCVPVTCLPRS